MSETVRDLLLITPDFPPNRGGVAQYLQSFARHFSDRIRVVSSVQTPAGETSERYSFEQKKLLFDVFWPRWLKTTWLLIREASTCRTVITSHVLPFGTAAMVAAWFTKKPFVVIVHGMDVRLARRHKRALLAHVLHQAYLVIANSNSLAQELQSEFDLQNILTVYPCVDVAEAPNLSSSSMSETALMSEFRLLTVSRLIDRKGHDRVLKALAMLKLQDQLIAFQYTIVGTGSMQQELETLVQELDLSSHVHFLGDLDASQLKNVYQQADVFVMPIKDDPIDKEGFGLVFLEAAVYGVPAISTNMSGVNEAVVDGQTGILVSDNDLEGLASAILRLAQDSNLRHTLGEAARARVTAEFSCAAQFSKCDPYFV
jgi:phosphatidylinositol alpha-1,6-mannosyltransferase